MLIERRYFLAIAGAAAALPASGIVGLDEDNLFRQSGVSKTLVRETIPALRHSRTRSNPIAGAAELLNLHLDDDLNAYEVVAPQLRDLLTRDPGFAGRLDMVNELKRAYSWLGLMPDMDFLASIAYPLTTASILPCTTADGIRAQANHGLDSALRHAPVMSPYDTATNVATGTTLTVAGVAMTTLGYNMASGATVALTGVVGATLFTAGLGCIAIGLYVLYKNYSNN